MALLSKNAFVSAISAMKQNEKNAKVTNAEVATAENPSVFEGLSMVRGRIRAQDVIDPYLVSKTRRHHAGSRMVNSEPSDREALRQESAITKGHSLVSEQ